MTVQEQVYLDGFVQKCAERGVDPEELVKKGFLVGATRHRGGNVVTKTSAAPRGTARLIAIAKELARRLDPAGIGYRKGFSHHGFVMPKRLLAYNPPMSRRPPKPIPMKGFKGYDHMNEIGQGHDLYSMVTRGDLRRRLQFADDLMRGST